ncbi:MAG: YbhB/YbcL family Raf kinase inhibitor-like protein [Acidobacteria bacterium]|nr:YbhB/YbcL family Raf kinase inhibitor-like protein [Acidobacteriota bacterium]
MAVLVALGATVLLGCGTSGRTLRDPAPGATAPPRSSPTSRPANQVLPDNAVIRPAGFSLSSVQWPADGPIPRSSTCAGADSSPQLILSGAPEGTAELLLVATDTAAPTRARWIVAGIAPTATDIPAGTIPDGAVAVINATGSAAWSGPCPRTAPISFQIQAFALPRISGLTATSTQSAVDAAIAGAIASVTLRGTAAP